MERKNIDKFFFRLSKVQPNPKTELIYKNPFTLLIAVVLSAQATDISVNKATVPLFEVAATPEDILALGEKRIRKYIKNIGLYNMKAKNIIALSRILVEKHQSSIPNNRQQLESLPGVGRKTANVVLNVVFNEPTIAVDTHIFRVGNRTGLARGTTPLIVEKALMENVPKKWRLHAHHWLILHGRYVCTARSPKCQNCHVSDLCEFEGKTSS